jgi:RNA polymerase sigma factor (sigma-70 family)
MPVAQLEPVVRFIRQSVHHAEPDDTELLQRFAAHRDEAAFSALVRRHGPLVLGVCRRVLHNTHTAEDAFQATFLLLVRKAGSLAYPEKLSSWLHGVACRVAGKARAREARRRTCEESVPVPAPALPDQGPDWRDLRVVLDEEINRLPARQRDAVVLCYLEGQTNAQAALRLGCPRGSVATLLSRARERLRQRLSGRGLALSAGLAGAWLARAEAAELPAPLTRATVEAAIQCAAGGLRAAALASSPAASLAKGVVRMMFLKKLKVTFALFLVLVALAGTGASLTGRPTQQPAQQSGDSRDFTLREALKRSLKHAGFRVRQEGAAWRISLSGVDVPVAQRIAAQRVHNTEVAYWNLYGGYWTLFGRKQGLRHALEAFRICKSRYEAGEVKADEGAQARAQCLLFHLQCRQAIEEVRVFERQLRALVGLDSEDGARLVPSDSPTLAAYRPNWSAALKEALQKRPELYMARQEIKKAQMDLAIASNKLLPDLRFLSSYDDNSLDGPDINGPKNSNALKNLAQMHNSHWSLGLRMVEPLGFRDAAGQVRSARLALERMTAILHDQERKAQSFLGRQYEQISVAYEQIRANRAQREAFPEQLRTRNEEYKAGRGSLDTLLEAQRFWADALANEHAAIVTYNNARAGFDFARGAALQRHRITVEEARRGGKTAESAGRAPRDGHAPARQDSRDDRLLTSQDLMRLLQISQTTFDELRAARSLPEPINLDSATGGTTLLRWPREEVLAWIDARCPPTAEWATIWARQRSRR